MIINCPSCSREINVSDDNTSGRTSCYRCKKYFTFDPEKRRKHRLARREDPEYVEMEKQWSRDYYSRNREQKTLANKRYYQKNKDRLMQIGMQRRREKKKKLIQIKGGKCQDCGFSGEDYLMEFHHEDPSIKESNYDWSKKNFNIDHLFLLCVMCHRRRHWGSD